MIYLLAIFIELGILFFLSRFLTRALSFLPINLISFIFLPGIILHELAHLLVANVLFVPTGEIEFMPKQEEGHIKLGSVAIAKTDPVRRFLIGIAPILAGLSVIFASFYFNVFENLNFWGSVLAVYVIFVIGNTMFSSRKDIEGSLILLVLIFIIFLSLYILGFRIQLETIEQYISSNSEIFKKGIVYLFPPIAIDILVLGLVRFLKKSY